ncbi:MAG: AI-2E family transporter [Pseudomonadota bacterium]|nr:AI-2E family transporter [Pseudomonadota bacterium]
MPAPHVVNRLLLLTLLVGLLILSYQILAFFISPVLWAAILAYVTWPLYRRLYTLLHGRRNLSALIMVSSLALIIGVPLLIGVFVLQQEARQLYVHLQGQLLAGQITVPELLTRLPVIGAQIEQMVREVNADPDQITQQTRQWVQSHLAYGKQIFNEISRNLARLSFALLTLFFMYRDGDRVLAQVRAALHKILDSRSEGYLQAIGQTTQAVVYGIGLTALAQALLAGLGYMVAGAPSPILLTLVTFLIALIPFGTPFAWGAVCIWMFSQGQTMPALGLALWGIFVVSWIDNIIRPMVISGATKVPFLLIMFGVLGGLAAFGMIGLFIGPVILAVLLAVWREWLAQEGVVIDTTAQPSPTNQASPTPDQSTN